MAVPVSAPRELRGTADRWRYPHGRSRRSCARRRDRRRRATGDDAVGGVVEVRVGEHHRGVRARHLQRAARQTRSGRGGQRAAGAFGAGEMDRGDAFVARERQASDGPPGTSTNSSGSTPAASTWACAEIAVAVASSDGFHTTALPAISAGAATPSSSATTGLTEMNRYHRVCWYRATGELTVERLDPDAELALEFHRGIANPGRGDRALRQPRGARASVKAVANCRPRPSAYRGFVTPIGLGRSTVLLVSTLGYFSVASGWRSASRAGSTSQRDVIQAPRDSARRRIQ